MEIGEKHTRYVRRRIQAAGRGTSPMSCLKVRPSRVDMAVGCERRGERIRGEDEVCARGHGDDRESGEVVLRSAATPIGGGCPV